MPKTERTPIKYKQRFEKKRPKRGRKPLKGVAKRVATVRKQTAKRHGISPKKVEIAILEERGLLDQVAKRLKVPRSTLADYIERHDHLLQAVGSARDSMGDVAERKLFEKIEEGDLRATLYYLSTVHRHRGYGPNVADAAENNSGKGPVYVETVNIIGVPSGTFLPREPKVIDNQPVPLSTDSP